MVFSSGRPVGIVPAYVYDVNIISSRNVHSVNI